MSLCFGLQSRPAQISDGTHDNTEQLEFPRGNIATISCQPPLRKRSGKMKRGGMLLAMCMILLAQACSKSGQDRAVPLPETPLNMKALKEALSYVRGKTETDEGWPRTIHYTHKIYDFRTDAFREESRVFQVQRKPSRIVPHAVGVAEILWAICPRERLIAFNDLSADPEFCVLAEEIQKRDRIFKTKQTELIIAYEPDLVFTVFYSGAEFKEKLKQARIPYFDLGHFGTLESIRSQILLIGRIIGEEGNAEALVESMKTKTRASVPWKSASAAENSVPSSRPPRRCDIVLSSG